MADESTLFQLCNIIKRRNVNKSPKESFTACEEFFILVVEAHVKAAALKVFGMKSTSETPCNSFFPKD